MSRKPRGKWEGKCPNCESTVTGVWEDFGNGSYEFWGAKGTDVDWHLVCPECGEELVDPREVA